MTCFHVRCRPAFGTEIKNSINNLYQPALPKRNSLLRFTLPKLRCICDQTLPKSVIRSQPDLAVLCEDNTAAYIVMAIARQLHYPAISSQWHSTLHNPVMEAQHEIVFAHIHGIMNSADALTESLGSTLHHQQYACHLMGH